MLVDKTIISSLFTGCSSKLHPLVKIRIWLRHTADLNDLIKCVDLLTSHISKQSIDSLAFVSVSFISLDLEHGHLFNFCRGYCYCDSNRLIIFHQLPTTSAFGAFVIIWFTDRCSSGLNVVIFLKSWMVWSVICYHPFRLSCVFFLLGRCRLLRSGGFLFSCLMLWAQTVLLHILEILSFNLGLIKSSFWQSTRVSSCLSA